MKGCPNIDAQGLAVDRIGRRQESWRHHADDGVRLTTKVDGFPKDFRFRMERALPKAAANHGQLRPVWHVLLARKFASQQRRYAKHAEKVRTDTFIADVFNPILRDQVNSSGCAEDSCVHQICVIANGFPLRSVLARIDVH